MKKKIIVGLLMVSALSFGAVNSNSEKMNNSGQKGIYYTQMMDNLSEKQQTELTKMMEDRRKANYKKSLDVRSEELKLEKLLSENKVNWKSVEKVNNEISDMKAKQRLESMKFRNNVENKYGISMRHRGTTGNVGKHMNDGHMGKRMNN